MPRTSVIFSCCTLLGLLLRSTWLPTTSASNDSLLVTPGNVTFALMLPIFGLSETNECGEVDPASLQVLVAVTWFLDKVNERNFVPGVKIGLEVHRTCMMPELAARQLVTLLSSYGDANNHTAKASSLLFGILGPDRTADATAVAAIMGLMPPGLQVLQISGSSTGRELSDKSLYPTFYRVIPPDSVQVKVMTKLLQELQWNYVALVHDDDDYGQQAARDLQALAASSGICISGVYSLPLNAKSELFQTRAEDIANTVRNDGVRCLIVIAGRLTTKEFVAALNDKVDFVEVIFSEAVGLSVSPLSSGQSLIAVTKGSLTTSPQPIAVPEFSDFLRALSSNDTLFALYASRIPWLQKPPESSPTLYVGYELKAAAVMTSLLRSLQRKNCPGVSGLCPALQQSVQARLDVKKELVEASFSLSELNFTCSAFSDMQPVTFSNSSGDINFRPIEAQYTVFNLKEISAGKFDFVQVGDYTGDRLVMRQNVTFYDARINTRAQCDNRTNCDRCVRDVSNDVLFLPGHDLYVLGLVPVSSTNLSSPLLCGPIKGHRGADIAEGLVYAVKVVNRKQGLFAGVLPNQTVGLVVINSCESPLHVQQQIIQFFAGEVRLPDGRSSAAILEQLIGVVGPLFSAVSIASSAVLSRLSPPLLQISPASTAVELSDRARHPYFMRLTAADDKQAKAIMDLVQQLGSDTMQVIYDVTAAYALGLSQLLMNQTVQGGGEYRICIVQSIATRPLAYASLYTNILHELRKFIQARIVVVILYGDTLERMLEGFKGVYSSAQDKFLFLGSDSWERQRTYASSGISLEGALVLANLVQSDEDFNSYFRSLDLGREQQNPWLATFWENNQNCYLDKSFRTLGRSKCSSNLPSNYVQLDNMVDLSVEALYALVRGYQGALQCNRAAGRLCKRPSLDEVKSIISACKRLTQDLYQRNESLPLFDSNGDGLLDFKVFRMTGGEYQLIGAWSPSTRLTLHSGQSLLSPGLQPFSSLCSSVYSVECQKCFAGKDGSGSQPLSVSELSVPIGASALVVIAILAVVVVILGVLLRRRHRPAMPDYGSGGMSESCDSRYESDASTVETSLSAPEPEKELLQLENKAEVQRKQSMPRYVGPPGYANDSGGGLSVRALGKVITRDGHPTFGALRVSCVDDPDVYDECEDSALGQGKNAYDNARPLPCRTPHPHEADYLTAIQTSDSGGGSAETLQRSRKVAGPEGGGHHHRKPATSPEPEYFTTVITSDEPSGVPNLGADVASWPAARSEPPARPPSGSLTYLNNVEETV